MLILKKKRTIKFFPAPTPSDAIDDVVKVISQQIINKPHATICFSGGSSINKIFKRLVSLNNENGKISFKEINLFSSSDFYNVQPQYSKVLNSQVFNENFVAPMKLDTRKVIYLTTENFKHYDKIIKANGGIDFLILGIGINGRISFNEPYTSPKSKTHIVELSRTTRYEYKRAFNDNLDDVPRQALTIGLKTILKAKHIILIAIGKDNDASVSKLFDDKYDPI
jgi:glucosamine-6-phosphate deaminase